MTKKHFENLQLDVIDKDLCTRCGICVGICPAIALSVNDDAYPVLTGKCTSCGFCYACCPGGNVDYPGLSQQVFDAGYDCEDVQGHTANQYVAHPSDNSIRFGGASGGMVTGLLCYLLKTGKIDGAVVVGTDELQPYLTTGILAENVSVIKECAQSKYCITPSMSVLQEIRKKKGRFAVVALPCQIHGLRKLEKVDPSLSNKIAYIFGLYCNCNLNLNGHIEALHTCGIKLDSIAKFNFRGGGWPGGFHAVRKDGSEVSLHPKIIIKDVMNVMFRLYGSTRCYLCVDALAEYADLSFGDFWAFDFPPEFATKERCTLISQRTAAGLEVLKAAEQDGAISMHVLPKELSSKRTLNMGAGKKKRAFVRMQRRKTSHRPYPNYNFTVPPITSKARRNEMAYRVFKLFRGPLWRKFILKILFSPIGVVLDKLNTARKNRFNSFRNK